jgi:hypothetical protein
MGFKSNQVKEPQPIVPPDARGHLTFPAYPVKYLCITPPTSRYY